ncbi:MAG: hypothetical protein AAF642_14885 [Pseudomonadota bacterium]
MKSRITAFGLTLMLAGCGTETEIVDPYADLAQDEMLVRFEANAEIPEGQCNPNVHYAMRTTEEFILLNANYEVVDQNLTGSGTSLVNEEDSGVARRTIELNMFDPYPVACSDLQIRVQEFTCRTEDDADSAPCPSPKFEGTEMFGSFEGLPNY